jgi:predicted RNA-binding protein YlqC (UPF0109 family)
MRGLSQYVARTLVDDPAAVRVTEVQAEPTVVYHLQVAPADVGKVIGKHGRNSARAATPAGGQCGRQGKRAVLEIKE